MSQNFNSPQYPNYESEPKDSESHQENNSDSILSNAKDEEHPLFSSKGLVNLINQSRNTANSIKEKQLSGEIKSTLIENLVKAARKTKVPLDILAFAMDWEKDLTSQDGSSAESTAKKIVNMIPQLRSSLGRDPMYAEIFAGFALGSASKVKEILEKSEKSPDEEAKSTGSSKDDIILKKGRNNKEKNRTNREVYDFFYKRIVNGKNTYKVYVTEDAYPEDPKSSA